MITEPDADRKDERKALALSVVASLVVNLLAWMLVIWGYGLSIVLPKPVIKEQEFIVSSSSIRIEHRTVPAPSRPVQQPKRASQPHPHPQPQQRVAAPAPKAQPTELARIVERASPQPRSAKTTTHQPSLAEQLAQQQQMFAREAQQLNASRAPLSIATNPPQPPSSSHQSYLDIAGRNNEESVQALLEPIRHWNANGMSCYYVHYHAEYGGGGSEDGNIPWPVCYPAAHDAMLPLDRTHRLPIPSPPTGYVLPPGTTLAPLLHAIYTGQIENSHAK